MDTFLLIYLAIKYSWLRHTLALSLSLILLAFYSEVPSSPAELEGLISSYTLTPEEAHTPSVFHTMNGSIPVYPLHAPIAPHIYQVNPLSPLSIEYSNNHASVLSIGRFLRPGEILNNYYYNIGFPYTVLGVYMEDPIHSLRVARSHCWVLATVNHGTSYAFNMLTGRLVREFDVEDGTANWVEALQDEEPDYAAILSTI